MTLYRRAWAKGVAVEGPGWALKYVIHTFNTVMTTRRLPDDTVLPRYTYDSRGKTLVDAGAKMGDDLSEKARILMMLLPQERQTRS